MGNTRVGQILCLIGAAGVVMFGAITSALCQDATPAAAVTATPAIGFDFPGLIQTVGFPAAAFIALFWQQRTTISEHTKAINELRIVVSELKVLVQSKEG